MPQISIIVPVYNTARYISRCIDSILAQSFTDFELILVNDGSIDNSGIICDEYAQKDNRITVIHKENSGTSSARNCGLETASGKYITFIDSDDCILPNYLADICYDYDLVICGVETIGNEKVIDFSNREGVLSNKSEIGNWFIADCNMLYLTAIWSKLFRRDIITDNQLKFDTMLVRGEDTIFVYNYLCHCKNIKLVQSASYHYYINTLNPDKKYALNAKSCVVHIIANTIVLNNIECKFSIALTKYLKSGHYLTYLHLFYIYLISSPYNEAKAELKTFRKLSNKLRLRNNLSFGNYLYWKILPYYPKHIKNRSL